LHDGPFFFLPMKIAVNTRLLLKDKLDGIGWFTYETMRRIAQQHPEVEFHFIFDRPFAKEFIPSKNVFAHIVPPPARHPVLMKLWYDVAVPLLLRKIKPDLFISPDAQCSLITSIPQLIVIHDINFEHYPNDVPVSFRSYLSIRSRKWAHKAVRIATVSEFSKKDICETYTVEADKVDVVYNGANSLYTPVSEEIKQATKSKFTKGQDYFVFVGSIHPRKNLQRLLPAFKAFKERTGSKMKLVVVGSAYWKNEEINAGLALFEGTDDLVMVGRLNAEELKDVVGSSMANVYVSYFEGFGIPIVEGFRAGVPVITSNVTSMPEVAGGAALLVDPFSVESISQGLEKIASDKNFREELVKKGTERAQFFSWDKAADALWSSIQKAMKN
jgi:glycosyltransferase involved in cell wall biosynthesis